jgi:hypothetical protein
VDRSQDCASEPQPGCTGEWRRRKWGGGSGRGGHGDFCTGGGAVDCTGGNGLPGWGHIPRTAPFPFTVDPPGLGCLEALSSRLTHSRREVPTPGGPWDPWLPIPCCSELPTCPGEWHTAFNRFQQIQPHLSSSLHLTAQRRASRNSRPSQSITLHGVWGLVRPSFQESLVGSGER